MLCQYAFEVSEAARVLVFELHARRSVCVLVRKYRHARRPDELGNGTRFRLKSHPLLRLGAVSATANTQGQRPIGMPESEVERGKAPHRQADDMRLVDSEVIQHGFNVVSGKGLRIRSGTLWYVRWRITSCVERNRAISPAKMSQLRFPASEIASEFVHEDNRHASSDFLVEEPDPVACDRVRHMFLQTGPDREELLTISGRTSLPFGHLGEFRSSRNFLRGRHAQTRALRLQSWGLPLSMVW